MSILFSVLIANYNNGRFIKEAVKSVFAQTYNNWEIILVDDASTDNSSIIIKELAQIDNRIKTYFNKENKGCGYTKHIACNYASGVLMGFLDPDDVLDIYALETMVSAHLENPLCGLINSNHFICDASLNIKRLSYGAGPISDGNSYLTQESGITAFATFKKEIYTKTPGINPNFKRAVDQDLYYKLEEVTKTKYIDIPLYYYRIHEGGISVNKNLYKSRYWFYKAKLDAYVRRKQNSINILNIQPKVLNAWLSLYFYTKANHFLLRFKLLHFFYYLLKGIFASPYDHLTPLKFKAVLLGTWVHKFSKKYND